MTSSNELPKLIHRHGDAVHDHPYVEGHIHDGWRGRDENGRRLDEPAILVSFYTTDCGVERAVANGSPPAKHWHGLTEHAHSNADAGHIHPNWTVAQALPCAFGDERDAVVPSKESDDESQGGDWVAREPTPSPIEAAIARYRAAFKEQNAAIKAQHDATLRFNKATTELDVAKLDMLRLAVDETEDNTAARPPVINRPPPQWN